MRLARMLVVVLALSAPLLEGCRTGRGARRETTLVEIENNLVIPRPLTVHAVREAGGRTLVGSVSPGARATLRFVAGDISGRYRFTAAASRAQVITSQWVALRGGDTVSWDLRANVIRVVQ